MSFPSELDGFITLFFKMDGYRIKVEVEREVSGGLSSKPPPPKSTLVKVKKHKTLMRRVGMAAEENMWKNTRLWWFLGRTARWTLLANQ
jgi:hypothetical protein